MAEQILIGNIPKGLVNNRTAFNIENGAMATLFNMYVWRGRAKRKRGTATLDRLQRQVQLAASPNNWQYAALVMFAGAANLITGPTLQTNADIVPGSISLVVGANTYTEPATPDGTLIGTPAGSGTINYSTGAVTIAGGGGSSITGTYSYYPDLPVLGLEDYISNLSNNQYPLTIAFDTTYAYQVKQTGGVATFYSVSYYKITNNPVVWSNTDDNQFWSTNYQSAFWATNNKPGFHFLTATYLSGSGSNVITFNFKNNGANFTTLVIGDVLWFNEWTASSINGLNGSVTDISDAANGNYVVTFTGSQTVSGTGITVMLTNSLPNQDGIRWYDGDPTNATGLPTGSGLGWVNFSPPLTATTTSINDLNPAKYYLVGALMIVNFKDRLLFWGPQIQSSGGVVYQRPIQDTVIFSWNGTPYYNALVPTSPSTTESFDPTAYYVDETGRGGYQPAGVSKPVVTVSPNEDVLLAGFGGTGLKTRLVYTGNDIQPFNFYLINSEYPSASTFSAIKMDVATLEIGQYGITATSQHACDRIDLEIPDEVFKIQSNNMGLNRVNGVRDFYREWIFWTFPTGSGVPSSASWKYPSSSLFYNYRDNTWAIFRENYTTQGTFRNTSSYTWLTLPFKTWDDWREPWIAGSSIAQFPTVIAGNPQGYVLKRVDSTGEAPSGDIKGIADNGGGFTRITSPNHCVNIGDYLYFSNCIGSTFLNKQIGMVMGTPSASLFDVDLEFVAGTYLGLGLYTRLSQPLIQTKQFPVYWQEGRKVRIGPQKYLFEATQSSQVTVNFYLSQDSTTVYNLDPVLPNPDATNDALIFSQLVYTYPESTNIGLTPANTNLQMPTAIGSQQIWHRMNTSVIGDTVQIGITLSDAQMRNLQYATDEIILHAMHLTADRGPILS